MWRQFITVFSLVVGLTVLSNCSPVEINERNTDFGANVEKGSCDPKKTYPGTSCVKDSPNSTNAMKSKTCNKQGTGFEIGDCEATGCKDGYFVKDGECAAKPCEANADLGKVSCKDEKENSTAAEKTKKCNATGTDFDFGDCIVESCANDYIKKDNKCVVKACNANQDYGKVACTVANATTAEKVKKCNADGTDFLAADCLVTECATGYYRSEDKKSCIAQKCTPGSASTMVPCEAADVNTAKVATSERSRTCKPNGSDYVFGSCVIRTCKAGYNLYQNTCRDNVCTPASPPLAEDCSNEIPNSVEATRDVPCLADGSARDRSKRCELVRCASGYVADFALDTCTLKICERNAIVTEDCSLPRAKTAKKEKKCNDAGTAYDPFKSCYATECQSGYDLKNGDCVAEPPLNIETLKIDGYIPKMQVKPQTTIALKAGVFLVWKKGTGPSVTFGSMDSQGRAAPVKAKNLNITVSGGRIVQTGPEYEDIQWTVPASEGNYTLSIKVKADGTNITQALVDAIGVGKRDYVINVDKGIVCPHVAGTCGANYDPAECRTVVDGRTYIGWGNNRCMAESYLGQQICALPNPAADNEVYCSMKASKAYILPDVGWQDFGTVGSAVTKTVTIYNPYPVDLFFESESFDMEGDSEFSLKEKTCGAKLNPGESCEVTVEFAPSMAKSYSGTVKLRTDIKVSGIGPTNSSIGFTGKGQ